MLPYILETKQEDGTWRAILAGVSVIQLQSIADAMFGKKRKQSYRIVDSETGNINIMHVNILN
jgi:hypothetical protein